MPCSSNLEINWDAVSRTVTPVSAGSAVVNTQIHLDIRLLPLLERDAMVALLRRSLQDAGWTHGADGTLTRDVGGVTATLSADGNSITLSLVRETEALGRTKDEAESRKKQLEARMETEALRAMEKAEPEVRADLQRALNETYRNALEARARQIGEIESLRESGDRGGSYEVTIVVKG